MNYARCLVVSLAIQVQLILANQTELPRTKIVGGYAVRIRDVPFLLALHIRREGFTCGAVILSAWWGMSALHCVKPNVTAKDYFARAGSTISFTGGTVHRLAKFYSFDSQYFDGQSIPSHDIVLFRVRRRFNFSGKVKPAKLPLDGITPPELLWIAGWGRTDISTEADPTSVYLRAANVTRVTWKVCFASTSWYESIVNENRHLCYGAENTDACYGDSGGPLADSQTVYGIVSFGNGCGSSPGIYTNVSFYKRWIKRITRI